jgi:putative exporter of polyketide antibiotics
MWRFSHFLSVKNVNWTPSWFLVALFEILSTYNFFIKVSYFLKTKQSEEWKIVLSLIFENFSRMRLTKFAILIYAAILNNSKKLFSMICFNLKAKQNEEHFFEQSEFMKFTQIYPPSWIFSKIPTESQSLKSVRIDIQM